MKFQLLLCVSLLLQIGIGQDTPNTWSHDKYYRLIKGSDQSGGLRAEIYSDIDSTWEKWKERGYHFGFDVHNTPMYTNVDGILSTSYMIQVRGNASEMHRKRWGYHVFEGFAQDDKSRITLLLNKHIELGRPVAEMYYYGTEYNHSEKAYNWFRIGSDVSHHSFLFGRDKAIFYGSLSLSNTLTLGNIGKDSLLEKAPEGDDEQNFEASAKHVNYRSLKEAKDGTLFYDKDHKMVVIKIGGKWMKLNVEPLPTGVEYNFE